MKTSNVVAPVSRPSAEELVRMYETFDGQSAEIKRQFREGSLTTEYVQALIEHRNPFANVVETSKVRERIFSLLKTITVGAVNAKATADCFTNPARYYYRDAGLDKCLPNVQPAQPESRFGVFQLTEPATFKAFVENVLGTEGDIKTLAKLLKDRGLTTTLPAIEALIERQENGEDIGIWTDGWANFFFTDNEDGESVSVVYLSRRGGQWGVSRFPLGNDGRWNTGGRVFLRNFSGN